MLQPLNNFLSRHKKKIVFGAFMLGGSVCAASFIKNRLRKSQENQTRELIEKTRRLQHFESTERTCNEAIIGLSTDLCNEIIKIVNTDEILEKLRQHPENKFDLWNELNIACFTRLTALVYATSMLVITLRVQLNILGGYIYKDTTTANALVTENIRQTYLSLIQHFHTEGLPNLIDLIKKKVRDVLKMYTLAQNMNLCDLEQVFWSIQMAVNSDAKDPNGNLIEYVLKKEIKTTDVMNNMFAETLDILESDDVAAICANNICRGFSIAIDSISENISDAKNSSMISDNGIVDINQITMPLAKLTPVIKGLTSINSKSQNFATSLVAFFLMTEKVKTLGANVYETFSV